MFFRCQRFLPFLMLVALTAAALSEPPTQRSLESLTTEQFLSLVRRPFRDDAWGRFRGRIQHQGDSGRRSRIPIEMALLFHQDFLRAQITLAKSQPYAVMQVYYEGTNPSLTLTPPAVEPEPNLHDLGIRPEDLAFSFLYWDIRREWPADSIRGQACRVIDLENAATGEWVRIWCHSRYLFPLQVHWFTADASTPHRQFEARNFKRHGDLWYVKTLALSGDSWKTQVEFSDGEMGVSAETKPPPNLFQ